MRDPEEDREPQRGPLIPLAWLARAIFRALKKLAERTRRSRVVFLLASLLVSQSAHAVDLSSTLFDGSDRDVDGYTTDCDDTDPMIYPGVVVGGGNHCASGWYRTCNTNGTWSACLNSAVTPYCPASGGGSCYYIDPGSGSDTTGDGSYSNPWASFKCVGWYSSGAPSCNITPADNSVIFLKGSTAYTTVYDADGAGSGYRDAIFVLDSTRNALTFARYPGSTSVITSSGSCPSTDATGMLIGNAGGGADNVTIQDFEITGGCGNTIGTPTGSGSDYLTVRRVYIHDTDGIRENNVAGIYVNNGNFAHLSRNKIIDVADQDETTEYSNVQGIVVFNDDTGGGHTIEYNRIGYDAAPSAAGNIRGSGIKFKHGASADSHSGNRVTGNIIWNVRDFGIRLYTGNVTVSRNLIHTSFKQGLHSDEDADSYLQSHLYEYNTVIDSYCFTITSDASGSTYHANPVGPIFFRKNICRDSGTAVDDSGGRGVRIDFYGSDDQYSYLYGGGKLIMTDNVYYNSATDFKWTLFGAASGDGGHGPAGNSGTTTTTFATWQALGLDSGSVLEDPTFDSSYRATTTNTSNRGWRTRAAISGTTTTKKKKRGRGR